MKTADGTREDSYDKCLLSPGGEPVVPPLDHIDLKHIHTFRGPEDTEAVYQRKRASKRAVVIGGGYIGVEVAEAYAAAGIDVTILDMADRLLATYLDQEFTPVLESLGEKAGVHFVGGQKVTGFKGQDGEVSAVVTETDEFPCDTVILSMGVKPSCGWLHDVLDHDEQGFIKVNEHLETSAPDVWAGGDSTTIPYAPTEERLPIGLATLARRQGIVAALNATGTPTKMPEMTGTSALSFCGLSFFTTGLKDTSADLYTGTVKATYVEEPIYPEFMRKEGFVRMKIHYDEASHRILGAQLMSGHDVSPAIAALSMAIQSKWTLEDLALTDIFFQPRFDRPWHYLNVLAMAALDYKIGGADQLLF